MKQKGFTLIATMLTLVIICILMVVMMNGYGGLMGGGATESHRKDGLGKTTMGAAKMTAEDQVCKSNLTQVREALAAAKMSSMDEGPQQITDAQLPKTMYSCPIGHEPYVIDSSGAVHCTHPGHENY